MTNRVLALAFLCVAASCKSRSSQERQAPTSSEEPPALSVLDHGKDPRRVASTLEGFTPITMLLVLEGTEKSETTTQAGRLVKPSSPFTMSTSFTFTLARSNVADSTFDIAMGSLQFVPDTTRNLSGWPLVATRAHEGALASLTTPGQHTDATALEETFGRFVRLMFVPVPLEPIGIGARWEIRQSVGNLDETTTFELVARTLSTLSIRVVGSLAEGHSIPLYRATFDGTLEAPIAPWRPATGKIRYIGHGEHGSARAIALDLEATAVITVKQ